MEKIFVKPAWEGAVIRHPEKLNYKLKPEGEWVTNSIHWQRYIKYGDVSLAQPPVETSKVEKSSKLAKVGAQ